METRKESIAKLNKRLPVRQCSNTGLWGYERIGDCLNLNRCVYRSKRAATIARNKAELPKVYSDGSDYFWGTDWEVSRYIELTSCLKGVTPDLVAVSQHCIVDLTQCKALADINRQLNS